MFCRNCGKPVYEEDKFCAHCGNALLVSQEEGKQKATKDALAHDPKEPVKSDSPAEEALENIDSQDFWNKEKKEAFDWNVHTFPSGTTQKTEDIDFDWKVDESQFKKRPEPIKDIEDGKEKIIIEKPEPFFTQKEETPESPEAEKPVESQEQKESSYKNSPVNKGKSFEEIKSAPPKWWNEETNKESEEESEEDLVEKKESEEVPKIEKETSKESTEPTDSTEKKEERPKKEKTATVGFGGFFKKLWSKEESVEKEPLSETANKEKPLEVGESGITGAPKLQQVVGPKMAVASGVSPDKKEAMDKKSLEKDEVKDWENKEETFKEETKTKPTQPDISEEKKEDVEIKGTPKMVGVVGPHLVGQSRLESKEKEEIPEEPKEESPQEKQEETPITGEALEKEIFEEQEKTTDKTRKRQTEKIDQFYTFNQHNAEFQKLLDQEYEKLQRETDGKQEEIIDRRGPEESFPAPLISEELSQKEEMARARELFFYEDVEEDPLKKKEEETAKEKEASSKETLIREKTSDEKSEEKETKIQEKEIKKEKEKEIESKAETEEKPLAKEEVPLEEKEELSPGEVKEGKKTGNIILTILAIVLIVLLILLGVRVFAPDSLLAQKTENMTDKIVNLFGAGEEQEATGQEKDFAFHKDITGVIQLELGKNKDDAIETIRYNRTLLYDNTLDYGNEDINNSKELVENLWYTDDSGKEHLLDRAIVGAVIDHQSRAAVDRAQEETVNTLDIGDIRRGENRYYVWISTYVTTVSGQAFTNNNILEVVDSNRTMNVVQTHSV